MAISNLQTRNISDIDLVLRRDSEFRDVAVVPGRNRYSEPTYVPWYSKMLTTMTLLSTGEKITAGFTEFVTGSDDAKFTVFTESLVITGTATNLNADAQVNTRAVPRSGLRAVELEASATVEMSDHRHAWPGDITALLEFDGLEPIRITFPGLDEFEVDKPSDGMNLLNELLKEDLS